MGAVFNVQTYKSIDVVTFCVRNKKNKQKEMINIITDIESYKNLIAGTEHWYLKQNSKTKGKHSYYLARNCPDTNGTIFYHREVLNLRNELRPYSKGFVGDHINRITLDNRYANLRENTFMGNALNNGTKHMRYKDFTITRVVRGKKISYQCYRNKIYIAYGGNLNEIKGRIDAYIRQAKNKKS